MNKISAPRHQLKDYARLVLLEMGIDINEVNLKEDGISINSFNKFVKIIYDAGVEDGLNRYSEIKNKKNKLLNEAKLINKHNQFGRMMSNMEKN